MVFLFSACARLTNQTQPEESHLTPFNTQTPASQLTAATPSPRPPTPQATPSPTPFIHTLALGETISTIALRYGLETKDILSINPQITPNALTVGTEILVPWRPPTNELPQVISEPLALALSEPRCTPTAEGGLWCLAVVSNPLDQPASGVTLTFTLLMSTGETMRSQTVPTLLNLLEPGQSMPAAAYFSPDVAADTPARVELASALPVDAAKALFLPVALKVNSINYRGRSALVSAILPAFERDGQVESIWVALIAYDEAGNIAGVRRMEVAPESDSPEGQALRLMVYSSGNIIARVEVRAEAQVSNE